MNNLIIQSNTSVKQIEQTLPRIVLSQIASYGSSIFIVKDEKDIQAINQAIPALKECLAQTATASEITKAITPIFATLSSQKTQQEDIKLEFATWVRLLEGEPLWAIQIAADEVCKTKRFRNLCDLITAIEKHTKPIVSKIKKLQLIRDESIKTIEEQQEIEKNSISVEQMQKNIANAAKNGNGFAKDYLNKKYNKDVIAHDKA